MIPLRTDRVHRTVPAVTWALVLLNVLIFVWDREGRIFGPSIVFADLAMRPREVLAVINGETWSDLPVITVFTSMFLHGSLWHIVGNLVFLVVFGRAVEDAIGSLRFTIYYLAWGVAAAMAQAYVIPYSSVPTLGASGAIGGVLGAYLMLFPASRIEMLIPFIFQSVEVKAWILLGLWFAWQILIPQDGVANWAHAGGFLAGMVTILVMGGPKAVLQGTDPPEYELV